MPDITIRDLAESDWPTYRALRLAALLESPDAFVGTYADESQKGGEFWRNRIGQAHRFVAEVDSTPVGVVGLGAHGDDPKDGEVFDLWVAPSARQAHVAMTLVAAAARQAAHEGRTSLFFWVLSDSAPAIAFASNYGFRPTSQRRPSTEDGEDEVAMVLSLAADPHAAPNPWIP
jgi:ribosomal protein S18 acetylase RimI-like enzyme